MFSHIRITNLRAGLTAVVLGSTLAACSHPWFKSGSSAPPDQEPVIATPEGVDRPAKPLWLSRIDACMATGASRNECIESLPSEDKRAFEAWERERAERRRALLDAR